MKTRIGWKRGVLFGSLSFAPVLLAFGWIFLTLMGGHLRFVAVLGEDLALVVSGILGAGIAVAGCVKGGWKGVVPVVGLLANVGWAAFCIYGMTQTTYY